MDMRMGVLFPEQQDFQMPGVWIPSTPGKPVLSETQHAAAAGGQMYYPAGMNWPEPVVGLPLGAACGRRVVQEGACQAGNSVSAGLARGVLDLNSCEAGVASPGGVSGSMTFSSAPAMRGATQGWPHVLHSDLVAMASDADAPRTIGTSPVAFVFGDTRSDCQQPITPLLLNRRIALNTELLNSVHSLSSSCEVAAPQFVPVTPDKQKGAHDGHHLGGAASLDVGEVARGEQEQASISPAFDPAAKDQVVQLHFDQGVAEQACFSSVGLTTQLQERETQEKAGQGVDLNQTLAQKPRRKKHKPMVVVEGRPGRTPKPATPNPATPKPAGAREGTLGKRKYVRRKGVNTPLETSPGVLGGETTKPHVKRARSARRQPDFSHGVDKVTCQGTTNSEQTQGESIREEDIDDSTRNSTGHGTRSTNEASGGQKVNLNSSAGIASSPNHPNNQVFDSYLKSLETPSWFLQPSRRELIRESIREKCIGDSTGNSTGHGTRSTDEADGGQKVNLNSSAGIASSPNHPNNQVLDSYLKSLETPSWPRQPSRRELIRESIRGKGLDDKRVQRSSPITMENYAVANMVEEYARVVEDQKGKGIQWYSKKARLGSLTPSNIERSETSSIRRLGLPLPMGTLASPLPLLPTALCAICMEDKLLSECCSVEGCTHLFCYDCISQYVVAKVQENVIAIKCPQPDCKDGSLEPEICRPFLPVDVFDQWCTALCEALFMGDMRFYCPFKD